MNNEGIYVGILMEVALFLTCRQFKELRRAAENKKSSHAAPRDRSDFCARRRASKVAASRQCDTPHHKFSFTPHSFTRLTNADFLSVERGDVSFGRKVTFRRSLLPTSSV